MQEGTEQSHLYLCFELWSLPDMACLAYSVFSSASVKFSAKKPLSLLPFGSIVLHLVGYMTRFDTNAVPSI